MAVTTETVIVQYEADVSNLARGLDKIEAEQKQIQASGKSAMSSIEQGAKKASMATQQASKSTTELKGKLNDLSNNLPYVAQIKQVTELGSAITSLGGSAQKSSVGFQVLKVAIESTGIGLLIAAIVSLIAYFRKTDEGATRLTGVMSAFNAALDLVTGSVVGFGDRVFQSLKSIENLKDGLSDLGNFLIDNLVNRLKAPLVAFEALQLAIGGDFEKASLRFLDATTQLASGITDVTSKTQSFIKEAEQAALAAYEWEKSMDALQDKMREDSIIIAENDRAITKLIISSKNKQLEDEKALANLDEASRLEKQNLAITLQNESAKLKLIQERNKRESDAINQDIKNGQTRRSINDNLAQEEVDQIIKISQLKQSSDNLLEKIQNRRDAKTEEIFQNQVKRIAQEEELKENAAKADFINGTTSAQELEDAIYKIKLEGLMNQKELLLSESRDIADIDKAILDLQLANLMKYNKEREALIKEEKDRASKEEKERLEKERKYKEEADKKDLERQKQHESNLNAIRDAGFSIAQDLATGFYDISQQKRQEDLQKELEKSSKQTDSEIESLQKQADAGFITQEQANARIDALKRKQEAKEAEIKKKQFQNDKKASLVRVAIETALAAIKAYAQLGPIGGVLGAALVIAQGAAQAALIAAQPVPKFAKGVIDLKGKGTGTSDSIDAKLSRGESVMTAKETAEHRGSLEAMRAKKYNQYIQSKFVAPALEQMQRESIKKKDAVHMASQKQLELIAQNSTDTSKIEYLLKKNKDVGIKNASEIGKAVAREMQLNSSWYK